MATRRTHASGTSGNGPHPEFDGIGEIKLKGFSVSTEMFVARPADEEEYATFPARSADEEEYAAFPARSADEEE